MIDGLGTLIWRDVRQSYASGGTWLPVIFYLSAATLFPFAVGPDRALLLQTGGGILWISALLATLLPLDRLIQPDLDSGFHDQLVVRGFTDELIAFPRLVSHWLAFGPPLLLAALLASGEIKSVELVEHYLQRIERFNATLNAYLTIDAEGALERELGRECEILWCSRTMHVWYALVIVLPMLVALGVGIWARYEWLQATASAVLAVYVLVYVIGLLNLFICGRDCRHEAIKTRSAAYCEALLTAIVPVAIMIALIVYISVEAE